jgi:hypothetical protein
VEFFVVMSSSLDVRTSPAANLYPSFPAPIVRID